MSRYILIDLEDTITIHNYKNRYNNLMIEWLKFNNVKNPKKIFFNPKFKTRSTRLELLNINIKTYETWYKNLNDIEFEVYVKKYNQGKIKIKKDTIDFLKNIKIPIILVSNSSPKWVDFVLDKFDIKKYFKYVFKRTYEFDDIKKPNKKVVEIIEKEINDKISSDSIVIGDSSNDSGLAENCGLNFIGINTKLKNYTCFKSFKKIYNYIENLTKN